MPQPNECLSTSDAFFLYLEQPGAPLNVAAISVFEGVISLEECTRHIESRLPLMPRFSQHVVPPLFGIGVPTWQFDPAFDICNHMREQTLKRGTEAEFKAAVSDLLSTHFDRNRPLWDITLFQGLQRSRTGVVIRTHHCLMDGVAGVGMLKALLDESPEVTQPRARRKVKPPAPPDPSTALLDGLVNACFSAGQALLTAHFELLQMAQQLFGSPRTSDAKSTPDSGAAPVSAISQILKLVTSLSDLARPVNRLPFNTLCHGPQKFEWLQIPMADVIAVKQACGGTVNDVVLTTLTTTLRHYAEEHSCPMKGRTLRIVAPVNLRETIEAEGTGNHITFLPVDIPFQRRTVRKLFTSIQQSVSSSRTACAAELVGIISTLLGTVPSHLQMLIGNVLSRLPISLCNSICTNVPGPRTPLFLMGHKMLSCYPYVPIGGEMGMNCAVLSYNGALFVGFTGDAKGIPDIERLPVLFRESFVELKDAFGVNAAKRQAPRRKRPDTKKMEVPAKNEPNMIEMPQSTVLAA